MVAQDFDDILDQIGGFGRFQKILCTLSFFLVIPAAMITYTPMFILTVPKHRCALEGYQGDTYAVQNDHHLELINASIPLNDDGNMHKCNILTGNEDLWNSSVPAGNATGVAQCTKWVYDKTMFDRSLIEKLDLVCNRLHYRTFANVLQLAAKAIMAPLQGLMSDYLGRRVSIIVISSLLIVASFASSFIYNIPSLLVLRFLTGVGSVQAYTASYVLALEFLTPVHRNRFNVVLNIMWVLGGFLLTGLAYFVRDFQHLCYAIGGPVVVLVILTWLAPESPRWYLVKGRHEECRKVLERVARINKAPFPQELFQKMIKKNTVPQQKEQLTKQAEGDELVKRGISDGELVAGDACEETTVTVRAGRKENYLTLYKHKDTGIRMLIFVLNWTVNALVYYALVFNVSNMGGSIYVNFAFTNGADLLGLIVVFVVVDRLGRKASYEAFLLLSAVACLATVIPFYFAEPGMTSTIVNILSLIGRFGVSSSFNILFMFSSEFVPTPLRTTSLGIFSLSSRLGSVSGPFIADVGVLLGGRMKEVLPLLVCGIAGLIAFLSALILPETNKQSLPNTIADTKNLIKSQKKKGTPSLGSFVRVTDLDVPVFIPDRGTSEEESRLKLSGI